MKKKWTMICILTLALAVTTLQGMAQTPPNQTTPPTDQSAPNSTSPSAAQSEAGQATADPELAAKVEARLQQLSTELGLSDVQKNELKPILQEEFKRLKAVKDDTTRSVEDKKEKSKDVQESARDQMKQVLSPNQQKKLAELTENDDQ
jgi:Spy/CpxP family protein refolding chaperone